MRRLTALIPLALTALVVACNLGPGNSPSPSVPPTPTAPPTPTPSPTFGPDQISHPTGAHDIVLRMEQGGGFVPFGFLFTQAPSFTLYGDGTVIFKPIDNRMNDPFGGQAFLPWQVGHISEADIQSLLQYALETGRLAVARENYENNMVADAGSTIFTINAGDVEKVVNVYALFEVPDPGPDQADRTGFSKLAAVLNDFQNQSGLDLGELTTYDPSHYKVLAMAGFGEPVGQAIAWPWDDVDWADWQPDPNTGSHEGVMTREQIALLTDVPNGGHVGVWVETPDGSLVQFGIRPMLPEEIDESVNGDG